MAVGMSTRKLLWARSHNRCAMCRRKLTDDAESSTLPGLIFGMEAHIVAQSPDGPRGLSVDRESIEIDGFDNLILLCPEDHKRADDQPDIYTRESLIAKKKAHEAWADSKFEAGEEQPPIRVQAGADEDSIPLEALTNGPDVWALIRGAAVFVPHEFDDDDEARNDAADAFIGAVTEWGSIQEAYADSPTQLRHVKRTLSELLQDLWAHELFAYGRRLARTISGGHLPSEPIVYVQIVVLTAERVRELQAGSPPAP